MIKLSNTEQAAVVTVLRELEDAADRAAIKFKIASVADRNPMLINSYIYWRNVRSGMRWAISQVKQRHGAKVGKDAEPVQ